MVIGLWEYVWLLVGGESHRQGRGGWLRSGCLGREREREREREGEREREREREMEMLGEGEPICGLVFVLLIHL